MKVKNHKRMVAAAVVAFLLFAGCAPDEWQYEIRERELKEHRVEQLEKLDRIIELLEGDEV